MDCAINITGDSNDSNIVLESNNANINVNNSKSDNNNEPHNNNDTISKLNHDLSIRKYGWDLLQDLDNTPVMQGKDEDENMVIFAYTTYLGRNPTNEELISGKKIVSSNEGLNQLENNIILSDEYNKFKEINPIKDLTGKIIIITGMSSGLGFLTAVLCAMRGATVVGYSRTPEIFTASKLSAAASNREDLAHPSYVGPINISLEVLDKIDYQVCDARDINQVENFYKYVENKYGSNIYCVYINHGVVSLGINNNISNAYKSIEDDIVDSPNRFVDYNKVSHNPINTNVWGNIFNNNYAIELLKKSNEEHKQIIYTHSIAAFEGETDYSMSKTTGFFHDIIKMAKILKKFNIKVNSICPNVNTSDMTIGSNGFININWINVKINNNKLIFPIDELKLANISDNKSVNFKNITQKLYNSISTYVAILKFPFIKVTSPLTIATEVLDFLNPLTPTISVKIQNIGYIPESTLNVNTITPFKPEDFGATYEQLVTLNNGINFKLLKQFIKDLFIQQLTGHWPGQETERGLKIQII